MESGKNVFTILFQKNMPEHDTAMSYVCWLQLLINGHLIITFRNQKHVYSLQRVNFASNYNEVLTVFTTFIQNSYLNTFTLALQFWTKFWYQTVAVSQHRHFSSSWIWRKLLNVIIFKEVFTLLLFNSCFSHVHIYTVSWFKFINGNHNILGEMLPSSDAAR